MNHIINQKFGRLTRINLETPVSEFICDCGKAVKKRIYDVMDGKIQSCGCLKSEIIAKRNKENSTHGMSRTPTGRSWTSMKSRCFNKNYHDYPCYGAVGITACEFIKSSPINLEFLIGKRPPGKTLDRTNNNLGYLCGECAECLSKGNPLNVRWATPTEQGRNQSTNRLITINGETKCVTAWAEHVGIHESVIRNRIRRGWGEDKLIFPIGTVLNKKTYNLKGKEKTLTEISKEFKIPTSTFLGRLKRGWSIEKALTT